MRVTNALVTRSLARRLQTSQQQLAEAQERVASGKRVRKLSDDPTDGASIMGASTQLRAVQQYRRNVTTLGSKVTAEETALDQVTQLLTRARELGVGQLGANATAATRTGTAAEVRQLLGEALLVANQKVGDDYLFGGTTVQGRPPFDAAQTGTAPRFVPLVAGVSAPPEGVRQVEAGAGQVVPGPHDGTTVFVDTRVLDALHELDVALAADDTTGIATAMAAVDTAFAGVQALVGEVGARQNQIDTVTARLDALEQNLDAYRSELSDVDVEQAITEMVGRQTAYQAAMLASSRVLGMSLTDYLR